MFIQVNFTPLHLELCWVNVAHCTDCFSVLQVFLASVEQFESWLSNKEAFLSNQDLGVRTACLLH